MSRPAAVGGLIPGELRRLRGGARTMAPTAAGVARKRKAQQARVGWATRPPAPHHTPRAGAGEGARLGRDERGPLPRGRGTELSSIRSPSLALECAEFDPALPISPQRARIATSSLDLAAPRVGGWMAQCSSRATNP